MHKIRAMRWHLTSLALLVVVAMGLLMTGTSGTIAAKESGADGLMREGLQAYQRGAFDKALASWKQAAQSYEQEDKPMEQSRALVAAAQASEAMGQVTQALQQLEVALALAQKSQDKVWTATVQSSLGHAYLAGRQPDAAMSHLTQAMETAPQDATPVIAGIQNNLGLTQVAQKKLPEALASFTDAAKNAEAAGDRPLTVRTRINAGRTALALNQPEAARGWLDKALDGLKDFPPSHEKATDLIQIGLGYHQLRTGMPTNGTALLLRAAGAFVEAGDVSDKIGDVRTRSYADGYLGHLYETERRYDEGLQLTRQAIFSAQAANAPESLYRWEWQLGRLLADTGKLDDAITAYYRAADALKPIRMEVASAQSFGSVSAEEPIKPLFFEQADLLFQRATLTADDKAAEEYLRYARDAIETYKAAELRDYFRDQCVDALQAKIAKLDTIDPTTAVIYPIAFPDRIEVLASFSSGIRRYSVPITSADMTKEVRLFRQTVEKRTTLEYLDHSQQLYDWLIRPLESELIRHKIQTLVFVPDGALRTIPFSALHDGKSFLIQQYAIAMTPSLYLTDPRPLNLAKIRTLAGGLISSVQGYPSLPYVKDEVESVRTLFQADQLINEEFRTGLLEQELRESRYGILHIATHGKFSTDAHDSFLLTFDGKMTMDKLDQLIGLFRYRQDPLELLTLSACQTAVGDDRAALGLAGVAIKAGARSALATLWFINDEASAALVAEFYRQLRDPSVSKAVAIQRAQIKLLNDRVYDHPAYWSPFLLLNNWL